MFVTTQAMRTPMRLLIEEYTALTVGLARNTIAQRQSQARNWLLPKWGDWAVGSVSKQAESPRRVRRAYCWCQPACSRGSVRAYSSCSSSIGVRSSIELWMRSVLNHCTQSAVAAST
jgi:hypothetical protein